MELIRTKTPRPWTVLIYGVPGCGKSTLAALAPGAVVVDLEDGVSRIDGVKTPLVKDWETFRQVMADLVKDPEFSTIVIDTLPALEEILIKKIMVENGKDPTKGSLADFPYGTGFEALKAKWTHFISITNAINNAGKNVLCVAHEQVEEVKNPSGENFDRYTINCHKKSVPLIVSRMDGVLYAHYEKMLVSKQNDSKMAVATGKRYLLTQEKPFALAKNRFNLPELMPFSTRDEIKTFYAGVI